MPSKPPGPPNDAPFERLAALIRRELHAAGVRVLEPGAVAPTAANVIVAALHDGRHVAVTFAEAPADADALKRRLEILVRTFAQSLETIPEEQRAARPPVARSLHDELRALATRAQAHDAVVLDGHSPVVWGSATQIRPHALEHPDDLHERLHQLHLSRLELLGPPAAPSEPAAGGDANADAQADAESSPAVTGEVPTPLESSHVLRDLEEGEEDPPELTVRVISAVRSLSALGQLRRGRPLHHVVREPGMGYLAHAFAGIYILVLVYDGVFDELRAERAVLDALPRIERLVLALPPLDPTPEPRANVIALRRLRRR